MSRSLPGEDEAPGSVLPHIGGTSHSHARIASPTMSSDPRVFAGRCKEAWKIASKLRYREQRKE